MMTAQSGPIRVPATRRPRQALCRTDRQFPQEAGVLRCAGRHEGRVLTGQHKARAHVDVTRHDRLVIDPGHSRKLAVLARRLDRSSPGLASRRLAKATFVVGGSGKGREILALAGDRLRPVMIKMCHKCAFGQ